MHIDRIRQFAPIFLLVGGFAQAAGVVALSGRVLSTSGSPLQGVVVSLSGRQESTVSGSNGAWVLPAVSGLVGLLDAPSGIEGSGGIRLVISGGKIRLAVEGRTVDGREFARTPQRPRTVSPVAGRTAMLVPDTLKLALQGFVPLSIPLQSLEGVIDTTLAPRSEPPFARIPAGTFTMGSAGVSGATPHSVTLSAFSIDSFEVTRASYLSVMGRDPSASSATTCTRCPVESVSWYDALRYCNARSQMEGRPVAYDLGDLDSTRWTWIRGSLGYRLPTEAEWEYAARGGSKDDFFWGASMIDSASVSRYAWYQLNGGGTTHPVGTRASNGYGLKDVAGNVWEWVWDWHKTLPATAETNPAGPTGVVDRVSKVLRGGSFTSFNVDVPQTRRIPSLPDTRYSDIGFRVVVGGGGN